MRELKQKATLNEEKNSLNYSLNTRDVERSYVNKLIFIEIMNSCDNSPLHRRKFQLFYLFSVAQTRWSLVKLLFHALSNGKTYNFTFFFIQFWIEWNVKNSKMEKKTLEEFSSSSNFHLDDVYVDVSEQEVTLLMIKKWKSYNLFSL